MTKAPTMTLRLPPGIGARLDALAHSTKRSKSALALEAIAEYVERNTWQVARIEAALSEAAGGRAGIGHAVVKRWLRSLGSGSALPRPGAG